MDVCRITVLRGRSLGMNNFKLFYHHPPKEEKRKKKNCLKERESFLSLEVARLRQRWVGFYGGRV